MNNELREYIVNNIPEHMQPGLIDYIERGTPPGGFLRCVLENNLFAACMHGDHVNRKRLDDYGCLLLRLPVAAWGSRERVDEWVADARQERESCDAQSESE